MKELNELVEQAEKADAVANLLDGVNPHTILNIDEAFRELEGRLLAAEVRAKAVEAQLDELAERAREQKPFMYAIMTANGDAHFEDFCVSSDPGLLEDEIWEWNNGLADNEPKNQVVPLFTRPAPALSLSALDNFAMYMADESVKSGNYPDGWQGKASNAAHEYAEDCRAGIPRKIGEVK